MVKMIEKFKNIIGSYKFFIAGIPEHIGELIACMLYLAFSTGMVMIVVGLSEGSNLALGGGVAVSGGIFALTYSV